jgi:hypothetical protein
MPSKFLISGMLKVFIFLDVDALATPKSTAGEERRRREGEGAGKPMQTILNEE